MPKSPDLIVLGKRVRQDQQTGYVCLTDLSSLKGNGRFHIANWLRAVQTILFIEEWEQKYNPMFNAVDFDYIKQGMGENTFTRSANDFIRAGCIGIFSRKGRYGGTYADIHWAIHFANWLDPKFYLETLSSYLDMHKSLYGPDAAQERFARELAAENTKLVAAATQSMLPETADKMVRRYKMASEMDMINVTVFGLTAAEWRKKFKPRNPKDNMRNYATPGELKIVAHLEHLNSTYIRHAGDEETRLRLLIEEAQRLFEHFFDTPDKKAKLAFIREKRGW